MSAVPPLRLEAPFFRREIVLATLPPHFIRCDAAGTLLLEGAALRDEPAWEALTQALRLSLEAALGQAPSPFSER